MKLIVVLSIAEYQERVARLLHEAGIVRFSTVNITGYKKGKERASLNWFGRGASGAKTNSLMLFSFAPEEIVNDAIRRIKHCNAECGDLFPVHGFVLEVENFSKFI